MDDIGRKTPPDLPLATLFCTGTGTPSIDVLDTMLLAVDHQIEENKLQIEQCLNSLLKHTNNVPGMSTSFSTPLEAISHMTEKHCLEKITCYDPDTEVVVSFLKQVLKTLDEHPGCEEEVLEDLLNFSEQEGISLPLKVSVASHMTDSMVSINTVPDESEQVVVHVWNKIANHLRRYFVDELSKLPLAKLSEQSNAYFAKQKRLYYVQSLCTLYPVEDVWERYKSLRTQQVGHCFSMLLSEATSEDIDLIEAGQNCKDLSEMIKRMICEDFTLFASGVFRKVITTFKSLHQIYLEKFSDEMSALVDEVQDEISSAQAKRLSQLKRHSFGFSVFGSSPLKRGNSKSMDSMLGQGSDDGQAQNASSPTGVVPQKYLEVVIEIVKAFLSIEAYIADLHDSMSWEVAGVASKKRKSSLRGVLKSSPSPDLMRRPLPVSMAGEPALTSSDTAISELVQQMPRPSSESYSSQDLKTPRVIEKTQVEDKPRWNWRPIFKRLAPDIAKCVEIWIQNAMQRFLSNCQGTGVDDKGLTADHVDEELVIGHQYDYPKQILKHVLVLINIFDGILPLAIAGMEGVFHTTRTAFVESVNLCLKSIHSQLPKLCGDVPKTQPMRNLYLCLSSVAYISNHIHAYNQILADDSGKSLFASVQDQFVELYDNLTDHMLEIHCNVFDTCILFDAESQNWHEMKEFYENERCSYTVQMWNHHLQCIKHDLWTICPPRRSQQVLASIVHRSLITLVQRYTKVKPSFRRVIQYRSDITAILLCSGELLFSICSKPSQLLDVSWQQQPYYNIHNLCSCLLAAMAVVSSPLEALYKVFKKGFTARQIFASSFDTEDKESASWPTQWLPWIQSHLIGQGSRHYCDLQTTSALYMHVKLMSCQPLPEWALLIQSLVMKDYTLPILLLTSAVDSLQGSHSNTPQFDNTSKSDISVSTDSCQSQLLDIFSSLFRVLSQSSHFSDALGKVILPVISRCNDWELLTASAYPNKSEKVPVWLQAVYELMAPFTERLLTPVVTEIIVNQKAVAEVAEVSALLHELPCSCPQRSRSQTTCNKQTLDNQGLVDLCLEDIVTRTANEVDLLPTHVCVMFKLLQETATYRKVKVAKHCIGVQILAGCVRWKLQDFSFVEHVTGSYVNQAMRKLFVVLSDSVYDLFVSAAKKASSRAPREPVPTGQQYKQWLLSKIESIAEYLESPLFDTAETSLLDGSAGEFQEQFFVAIANSVLSTSTGKQDLELLYNFVLNNQCWMEQQFDLHSPLEIQTEESERSTPTLCLSLDTSPRPRPHKLNPLTSFNKIGDKPFHHDSIMNFHFDWVRLLQSDLGMSEIGFRELVRNRHEFQDGAYLEDNEKKPVSVLRQALDLERCELV